MLVHQPKSIYQKWLTLLTTAALLAALLVFQSSVASAATTDPDVSGISIVSSNVSGVQEVNATITFDENVQLASGATAADLAAELSVTINGNAISNSLTNRMAFEVASVGTNNIVVRVFENTAVSGMFALMGANMTVKTADASEELDSLVASDNLAKANLLDTDFLDKIIDTGIRVTTLSTTVGAVGVNPEVEGQITAVPQVRGISWFQLLKNGVVVPYKYDPVEDDYNYTWPNPIELTGAVPLHSHSFTTLEADDYVAALETAINNDPYLSATYELTIDTLDPTKFTIEKTTGGVSETLSIRFFTYQLQ